MVQKFLAGREIGGGPAVTAKEPLAEGIATKRFKSVSAMARHLADELGLRTAVVETYFFKIPKKEDGLRGYSESEYGRLKKVVLEMMAENGGLKPRGNMSNSKEAKGEVPATVVKIDPERILESELRSCKGSEYERKLLELMGRYFAGVVDSGFRAHAHGNGNGKKAKACGDAGRFASLNFTNNLRNHLAGREDARELLGAFVKKWSQTLSEYSRNNETAVAAMDSCPVQSYNLEIALRIITVQLRE